MSIRVKRRPTRLTLLAEVLANILGLPGDNKYENDLVNVMQEASARPENGLYNPQLADKFAKSCSQMQALIEQMTSVPSPKPLTKIKEIFPANFNGVGLRQITEEALRANFCLNDILTQLATLDKGCTSLYLAGRPVSVSPTSSLSLFAALALAKYGDETKTRYLMDKMSAHAIRDPSTFQQLLSLFTELPETQVVTRVSGDVDVRGTLKRHFAGRRNKLQNALTGCKYTSSDYEYHRFADVLLARLGYKDVTSPESFRTILEEFASMQNEISRALSNLMARKKLHFKSDEVKLEISTHMVPCLAAYLDTVQKLLYRKEEIAKEVMWVEHSDSTKISNIEAFWTSLTGAQDSKMDCLGVPFTSEVAADFVRVILAELFVKDSAALLELWTRRQNSLGRSRLLKGDVDEIDTKLVSNMLASLSGRSQKNAQGFLRDLFAQTYSSVLIEHAERGDSFKFWVPTHVPRKSLPESTRVFQLHTSKKAGPRAIHMTVKDEPFAPDMLTLEVLKGFCREKIRC